MLNTNVVQSNNTGFSSTSSKQKSKHWIDNIYVPVIFKPFGPLEDSDQVIWVHISKLDNPGAYITEHQISSQLNNELTTQEPTILSTKEQLNSLRKTMGLNISDIAAILHVSRPTIYEWVDSEISVRSHHQKRLDEIYAICLFWKKKKAGNLNVYLYKKQNNTNKSLMTMLMEKKLDTKKIYYLLNQIEQIIFSKKLSHDKNKNLLKQHGFEDLSEEELEVHFKTNIQTIG